MMSGKKENSKDSLLDESSFEFLTYDSERYICFYHTDLEIISSNPSEVFSHRFTREAMMYNLTTCQV